MNHKGTKAQRKRKDGRFVGWVEARNPTKAKVLFAEIGHFSAPR